MRSTVSWLNRRTDARQATTRLHRSVTSKLSSYKASVPLTIEVSTFIHHLFCRSAGSCCRCVLLFSCLSITSCGTWDSTYRETLIQSKDSSLRTFTYFHNTHTHTFTWFILVNRWNAKSLGCFVWEALWHWKFLSGLFVLDEEELMCVCSENHVLVAVD